MYYENAAAEILVVQSLAILIRGEQPADVKAYHPAAIPGSGLSGIEINSEQADRCTVRAASELLSLGEHIRVGAHRRPRQPSRRRGTECVKVQRGRAGRGQIGPARSFRPLLLQLLRQARQDLFDLGAWVPLG